MTIPHGVATGNPWETRGCVALAGEIICLPLNPVECGAFGLFADQLASGIAIADFEGDSGQRGD